MPLGYIQQAVVMSKPEAMNMSFKDI